MLMRVRQMKDKVPPEKNKVKNPPQLVTEQRQQHLRWKPLFLIIPFLIIVYKAFSQIWHETGFSYVATQCLFKSYSSLDTYSKSNAVYSNISDVVKSSISKEYSWIGAFPTDKFANHNYTKYYDMLFKEYLNKNKKDKYPINLLEVGVKKGGSLKLWRELFSASSFIYGIDIDPAIPTFVRDAHIKTLVTDTANVENIQNALGVGINFDIIIDDGCHSIRCVTQTFFALIGYLKDDGIYIIEDFRAGQAKYIDSYIQVDKSKYTLSVHADTNERTVIAFIYPKSSIAPLLDVGLLKRVRE